MQEPEERQRIVEAYLLEWLSHTLQIPLAQLHPEQLLNSYLDSLIALMLKSQIESDLEVRVPMEKFFGEQNIVQLAELLLNQLVLANLIASESVCVDDSHQEQKREKLSF
nr:acyl carrier protein [Fischerella thermalis]